VSPQAGDAGAASGAGGLERLLAAKEIVVFCGSGGVGKTSVAAAAALGAVNRLGGKVLVLTIDPARRLATALGLDGGVGNVVRRVPGDLLKAAGVEPRGELYAAMLDTKQSWDELVMRHAPDEATAYRILENRLYHNLTARFVESHDYIAMERLYELHQSGEYDLIVIDTPPTRNAADFLEAPKRMADFFGGRLLRWLTLPYRVGGRRGSRVLNVASRPFYQIADRILGSQFLEDIAEFFLNFQSMYSGFSTRAKAVERLLHDRRTTFAVVTTLEAAPLHEAEHFCDLLDAGRFHLGALVLNRTLPDSLLSVEGARAASRFTDDAPALAAALAASTGSEKTALSDQVRTARVLRTVGESFHNFSLVAKREAELRAELTRRPEVVARVPSFDDEITDLAGLMRVGNALFGDSPTGTTTS
jgi:anion-transporting  ArsA/GET3 family ATPase